MRNSLTRAAALTALAATLGLAPAAVVVSLRERVAVPAANSWGANSWGSVETAHNILDANSWG